MTVFGSRATQGATGDCGLKGGVVTVVLVVVDCREATQKNKALFVHLSSLRSMR